MIINCKTLGCVEWINDLRRSQKLSNSYKNEGELSRSAGSLSRNMHIRGVKTKHESEKIQPSMGDMSIDG